MTRYTPEQEAEIVGLAAGGVTHAEIGRRLGIPRTTVSHILERTQGDPDHQAAIVATRQAMTARLWEAFDDVLAGTVEAIDTNRAIVADDGARLLDRVRASEALARILETVATRHALLSGDVTSRSAVVNELDDHEAELLRDAIKGELARRQALSLERFMAEQAGTSEPAPDAEPDPAWALVRSVEGMTDVELAERAPELEAAFSRLDPAEGNGHVG